MLARFLIPGTVVYKGWLGWVRHDRAVLSSIDSSLKLCGLCLALLRPYGDIPATYTHAGPQAIVQTTAEDLLRQPHSTTYVLEHHSSLYHCSSAPLAIAARSTLHVKVQVV